MIPRIIRMFTAPGHPQGIGAANRADRSVDQLRNEHYEGVRTAMLDEAGHHRGATVVVVD